MQPPREALHSGEAYLVHTAQTPAALLLNDNSQLRGPWLESTDWLRLPKSPCGPSLARNAVVAAVPQLGCNQQ